MAVRLAESAGFCYGVKRAVNAVGEALAGGQPVATLGPIIHNPHVVSEFTRRGVKVLKSPGEVKPGDMVVIRSHGVSPGEIKELLDRGAAIMNMVCPHVEKIHKIVQGEARPVIIVGEFEHPEIRGVASRVGGECFTIAGGEDAETLPLLPEAVVVAQTTLPPEVFARTVEVLRGRVGDLEIHDTICLATRERQSEADKLSREVSAMLVVGGRESSNTRKLYELCARNCPTWLIEDSYEIPADELAGYQTIGITAGASTPDEIIKEVITVMNELDNITNREPEAPQQEAAQEEIAPEVSSIQPETAQAEQEEPQESDGKDSNFMTEFEKTLVSIRPGQFVTGSIVQITDDEVCVNIGYKSDGIIPRAELSSDEDLKSQFKIGDEIEVEVVKVNDGEGNVLLSQKNFMVMKNWGTLVEKYENGEFVEAVGKGVVKGGLICDVMGVRTFVPASQLAERYVEKIEQFIGQKMKLKIIEVDKPKRRFVASRKQVLVEEGKKLRDEVWEKIEKGAVVKGTVRRLTDFGAFVDIGGVDGLIHVTDLSWGRVRHPGDVVKPNDEIEVQILEVDRERNRISLGYKQLQAKPWDNAVVNYPVGSIVEGKVVRMVTFGAFVELEPGLDGLVHISQIANQRVNKVEDVLSVGQSVKVKVLDVNSEAKRVSLSIRDTIGAEDQHDDLDALPSDPGDVALVHSTDLQEEDAVEVSDSDLTQALDAADSIAEDTEK